MPYSRHGLVNHFLKRSGQASDPPGSPILGHGDSKCDFERGKAISVMHLSYWRHPHGLHMHMTIYMRRRVGPDTSALSAPETVGPAPRKPSLVHRCGLAAAGQELRALGCGRSRRSRAGSRGTCRKLAARLAPVVSGRQAPVLARAEAASQGWEWQTGDFAQALFRVRAARASYQSPSCQRSSLTHQ